VSPSGQVLVYVALLSLINRITSLDCKIFILGHLQYFNPNSYGFDPYAAMPQFRMNLNIQSNLSFIVTQVRAESMI
jgi:hypothetical protein